MTNIEDTSILHIFDSSDINVRKFLKWEYLVFYNESIPNETVLPRLKANETSIHLTTRTKTAMGWLSDEEYSYEDINPEENEDDEFDYGEEEMEYPGFAYPLDDPRDLEDIFDDKDAEENAVYASIRRDLQRRVEQEMEEDFGQQMDEIYNQRKKKRDRIQEIVDDEARKEGIKFAPVVRGKTNKKQEENATPLDVVENNNNVVDADDEECNALGGKQNNLTIFFVLRGRCRRRRRG